MVTAYLSVSVAWPCHKLLVREKQKLFSAAETEVTVNVKKNPPTVYT